MNNLQCPNCGSIKTRKNGVRNDRQRYLCTACEREYSHPIQQLSGNILIIGDTHIPSEHPDYLRFCVGVSKKYNVSEVYHVGDIVDNHSISYHEIDPRAPGAQNELEIAIDHLQNWYDAFPKMKVCYGNHDALFARKAKTVGLPRQAVRSLGDILGAPDGWEFADSFEIGDILVTHGSGFAGQYAFATASRNMMRSVVMGHLHSVCGIQYTASVDKLIFGMNVGCGIDRHSFAFDYAKNVARKPIISCGVLINGTQPVIEVMKI